MLQNTEPALFSLDRYGDEILRYERLSQLQQASYLRKWPGLCFILIERNELRERGGTEAGVRHTRVIARHETAAYSNAVTSDPI